MTNFPPSTPSPGRPPTRSLKIALAGNPNSGKTTLFNHLTGARQHVANYPGVTVEKKEGRCRHGQVELTVVDLPGTYSLTAHSLEEVVARDFILEQKPDVVIDVIDASNLERNLYLAVQLIELNAPVVLAFNMSDIAEARGLVFDNDALAEMLGAPIIATVASRKKGVTELLDAVIAVASGDTTLEQPVINYGPEIEDELRKLIPLVETHPLAEHYDSRWLAMKLLESDDQICGKLDDAGILQTVAASTRHLEEMRGDTPEILAADRRYGFISGATTEAVRSTVETRHTRSDRIDAILTNRVVGLPIFLALMYAVFYLVFTIGEIPMGWIESLFSWMSSALSGLWAPGGDSILRSLVVDGVIGGVGGVIVFLPNILLLFLAIALLEDTGYMARAAFLMDRLMHRIGLHGKSFIPMLIGFGCSVPAIMATRTLETRRDRLTTMLVVPLMSCGARLPIYALLIPAFFPSPWRGPMLWIIYLIGIALAVVCAKLLRATLFRGQSHQFVMELPPYRLPTGRGILMHMWHRAWMYLRKAGTVILAVSVVLWVLTRYPQKTEFDLDYDGARSALTDQYAANVRTLNALVSLPAESDALLAAVNPPAALAASQPAARMPESVTRFLQIRDQIVHAYRTYDDAAKGDIDPAEEALAVARRDAALAEAQRLNPGLYPAAVRFVNDIDVPYRRQLAELEHRRQAERLGYSVAGRVGHGMEPAIKPMGFDWKIGTALLGAFAAKEVFVAQMGIVHAVGETDEQSGALRERLAASYDGLQAFCIMLFCLIASPCVATLAVTKQESGGWKWPLLQWGGLTVLAYGLTVLVYQVGNLLR